VWTDQALLILNLTVEEPMKREGLARELINRAQKLKKKAGLHITDPVEVFVDVLEDKDDVKSLLDTHHNYFKQTAKYPLLSATYRPLHHLMILQGEDVVGNGSQVRISIIRATFSYNKVTLQKKCLSEKYASDLQLLISTRDFERVKHELKEQGKVAYSLLDKATVELVLGEDIFLSAGDLYLYLHK